VANKERVELLLKTENENNYFHLIIESFNNFSSSIFQKKNFKEFKKFARISSFPSIKETASFIYCG